MKLAYPKMIWMLAFCGFFIVGAQFLIVPLTTIYVHEGLGQPLAVAGLVLLLFSAGASLGQLAGGALFDRIGARFVLLLSLFLSAALLAVPALNANWTLYIAAMTGFGFSNALSLPVLNASATRFWPDGGVRMFNFLYVANNLGVAVGTAVGGWTAQVSFRLSFGIASGALLLLAFGVVFLFQEPAASPVPAHNEVAATHEVGGRIPWPSVLTLAFGNVLLWMVYVQWQSNVSVHMTEQGFSLSTYSLLWTWNGLLIFLAQPLLAAVTRRVRTPVAQMRLGMLLFLASYALLLYSANTAMYVAGMTVLTLGELLLWPVIPAVVSSLSPPDRQGFLQGFIGLAATLGRMAGPLLGGLAYEALPFAGFVAVMMGFIAVPLLGFAFLKR